MYGDHVSSRLKGGRGHWGHGRRVQPGRDPRRGPLRPGALGSCATPIPGTPVGEVDPPPLLPSEPVPDRGAPRASQHHDGGTPTELAVTLSLLTPSRGHRVGQGSVGVRPDYKSEEDPAPTEPAPVDVRP